MPSLQLYRNSEFKIENRVIHDLEEIFQAFVILAKTSSPFRSKETNIDELVGQSTEQLAKTAISARILEITKYMKTEYDIKNIGLEDIKLTDSGEFTVYVIMEDPSGRTFRGEVNVLS